MVKEIAYNWDVRYGEVKCGPFSKKYEIFFTLKNRNYI